MLDCNNQNEAEQLAKDLNEKTWGRPVVAVQLVSGQWVVTHADRLPAK